VVVVVVVEEKKCCEVARGALRDVLLLEALASAVGGFGGRCSSKQRLSESEM
jgi:hypothetical protein